MSFTCQTILPNQNLFNTSPGWATLCQVNTACLDPNKELDRLQIGKTPLLKPSFGQEPGDTIQTWELYKQLPDGRRQQLPRDLIALLRNRAELEAVPGPTASLTQQPRRLAFSHSPSMGCPPPASQHSPAAGSPHLTCMRNTGR